MAIKLNVVKSSSDRYYLIKESMGCAGLPLNHANHAYSVVNGIDRGNGYQGYMAISYALNECEYLPKSVKLAIKRILKNNGYNLNTLTNNT